MATKKKLLQAAAGQAGGAGLNVEEVFSTYLYTGTGATLNIVNGIDLAGEGGLVWHKYRGGTSDHGLFDTERGVSRKLTSNNTDAQTAAFSGYGITAFNSNGYTLGTQYSGENGNGNEVVSWTFRKAPKFFDVVTYTGNSTAGRTISHNLGSAPGMIIIKNLDVAVPWAVYHRSMGDGVGGGADENFYMNLNENFARAASSSYWNNTAPTSTTFTLGTANRVNATGSTYVAYLFAHNNGDGDFGPDADADIIKCGSFTTDGSGIADIDLGFEPQWIITKKTNETSDWEMFDVMRGWTNNTTDFLDNMLRANTSGSEYTGFDNRGHPTATGFRWQYTSNDSYIYIAIRRGPMAVPESATDVFAIDQWASGSPSFDSPFPVDFGFIRSTAGSAWNSGARLLGIKTLNIDNSIAEFDSSDLKWDHMDGFWELGADSNYYGWMWKRAPNYFDVVAYTGDATASPNTRNITHNLGVAPEMMWIKCRSAAENWAVYHSGIGATKYMNLNNTNAAATSANWWGNTAPTDTVFTIGHQDDVNLNGGTHIAYLFATLAGVSKVGSVSHTTGSNTDVDCGFSAGARFVILKGTHASGWQVFDTERGIVTGNDPTLTLHNTSAEDSTQDRIDPYSSGFSIGPDIATGTYIFYAIA